MSGVKKITPRRSRGGAQYILFSGSPDRQSDFAGGMQERPGRDLIKTYETETNRF